MLSPGRARQRRLSAFLIAGLLTAGIGSPASAADRHELSGFVTAADPMLLPLVEDVEATPLITVGDVIGNYRFESIPDGIALVPERHDRVGVYVNHETSKVPFPFTPATGVGLTDFDNAQMSHLVLRTRSARIVSGDYAIPSGANYQRFCSNFYAGKEEGWKRGLVLTNEEATDVVNRTGTAWPATPAFGSDPEQAGVAVAFDPALGEYRTIYGLGRMNHENSVAIPGYKQAVLVTGDDTFSAPASQLYMYLAANSDAVWNDEGHLWAFVSDDASINDYGDLSATTSVGGHFIAVPDAIADGDQTGLENWSKAAGVFQFIRIEDLAYDRKHNNVVYFADTGEPRAVRNSTTGLLDRAPSGTEGPFPNGRIFKMVLDRKNPTIVKSLSVLIDADASGYRNVAALHQPDNIETTKDSLLITEDPGGHNRFAGATNARVWRYDFKSGDLAPIAVVAHPTADWESSGIVDASRYFGRGAFLITVQAHSLFIETAPLPALPTVTQKREGGQLLLLRIDDDHDHDHHD